MPHRSLAHAEPLLHETVSRNFHHRGKALMLLSMLICLGFTIFLSQEQGQHIKPQTTAIRMYDYGLPYNNRMYEFGKNKARDAAKTCWDPTTAIRQGRLVKLPSQQYNKYDTVAIPLKPHRKKRSKVPSKLEEQVAKALWDVINGNPIPEIREIMRDVQIESATELLLDDGNTVILVDFPLPSWNQLINVHGRILQEMEKKFPGRQFVFVAHRTAYPKQKGVARPESRTIHHVHRELINDMVYPTYVTKRAVTFSQDGDRQMFICLDPVHQQMHEHRMTIYGELHKKLTGKKTTFLFDPVLLKARKPVFRKR